MTGRGVIAWAVFAAAATAQTAGVEFFEKKIRPVLASQCYACHSSKLKTPMGGLVLDTKAGTARVTANRILHAIRFNDPKLQMPPTGKLAGSVIADFEEWIRLGAPDPRSDAPVSASTEPGVNFEKGRKWWAFQPVREMATPKVSDPSWPRAKIDWFLLAKLDANRLKPSPEADRRTLIRRVYYDLTGLPPAYEEIESFAADSSPDTWPRLVERLLASQQYGERWGRHWMDVARYAEDHPTSEATNQPLPHAWRYRDWVIEAINKDIPYDRFVKMQLAADLMPGFERDDLRALGYIGNSPTYHKDLRLSKEVIETIASDDWDERVDAVTRGLLGLTVACARCHDHKFDPISTEDYHALAGVFASAWPVRRPLIPIESGDEIKVAAAHDRITWLDYLTKLLKNEPGTKAEESARKRENLLAELEKLKKETPPLPDSLAHAVIDGGLWIDGSDPDLTQMDFRVGLPRDLPVFIRGNVANPGPVVQRRFLTVLSKGAPEPFRRGSGRLELGERIFTDATPLAARVIVNRLWGWHFGRPLVPTASDFGTTGEPASHPDLLDDLAARFIANGWSWKWLHREILLSAAYRQSSRPRADGEQADPTNRWLWRYPPRRLDFESWRDSILQASGALKLNMYGPSTDLEVRGNHRRTVYAKVSRTRLHALFKLYDFSDPNQHGAGRETTTTPLQQLFVMNGLFVQDQAAALAVRTDIVESPAERIRAIYRHALARDPLPRETDLGLSFLQEGKWNEYAQALLASNELAFLQ